jgi:hypothetical protein
MADPIVVGTEVKAITGSNNTKMICAYRLTGSTGLPYVMVNSSTAGYYVVPANRKCIITEISFQNGTSSGGVNTVYIGSTANSTSGAHIAWVSNCSDLSVGETYPHKCYIEMAAGDYCNVNVTRNPTTVTMTAIEMDA